jgi:hypothetical protein
LDNERKFDPVILSGFFSKINQKMSKNDWF